MAVEEPIVNIYLTNPPTEYCQARYTVKQKPSKCRTKGKYMFCLPGEKQGYITCGTHLKALCDLSALGMDTQPMKPLPKNGKLLGYGDYENMEEQQCQALITAASGKEPPERCSSSKTFAFQSEQHDCILFLCKKHFSWIDNAYDHKSYIVQDTPDIQKDGEVVEEEESEQKTNIPDEEKYDHAKTAMSDGFIDSNESAVEDTDKLSLLTNGENGYVEANGVGEDSYSVEENNDIALQTSKTQSSSQQTSFSEHRNHSTNIHEKHTESENVANQQTEVSIYSPAESQSDSSLVEDKLQPEKKNSPTVSNSQKHDFIPELKEREENNQKVDIEKKETTELKTASDTQRIPPPPPKPQHYRPDEKTGKSKQKAAEGGCCVIS
ncbi:hypothetical protein GpartN1_g1669.t1 [Galdieria partita]|uniref:Uncharacterized protein n=1 Tax=Galdieria partita TaxID=83374 RepID=A0A9C7UNJ0_9RHOD|nr:hypothetical protein GpartN1_g1669.t1 [Galdieria partita]